MVIRLRFLPSTPLYLSPTLFSKPHFLTRLHVPKTTSALSLSLSAIKPKFPTLPRSAPKMVIPLRFLPSTPLYLSPTPFSKPHFLTRLHVPKTTSVSATSTSTSVSDSDPGLLFREKILYLENHLNIDSHKALQQNPNFRSADLSSLKSVERCLSSMGLELSAVGRILDMYPQLLTADPHSDLYPIFDYLLNEVKIPFSDIRKSVIRCPRLLVSDLDSQLRPTLVFLRNFGFTGFSAISSHTTALLVSSVELTLLPKINYLQSLGFSQKDVVNMVLRSPGLLTYSIPNNLVPKVEYFLKEMKGDLAELKRFPQYFSFSLEKKIKLRHRLLMEHRLSLPLSDMLKVSDGEFRAGLVEMRLQSIDRL